MLGQSVWSDDGKRYYEDAVKNWGAVYLDDSLMGNLVEGWDEWLKANGADERVDDVEMGVLGRKDLYDVIGTWSENDADNAHRGRRGQREAAYQKVKQPSDEADASDDEEQFYYSDGEKKTIKSLHIVGGSIIMLLMRMPTRRTMRWRRRKNNRIQQIKLGCYLPKFYPVLPGFSFFTPKGMVKVNLPCG